MSFLLIQSMIVATTKKSKRAGLRYSIVVIMLIIIWLEPLGIRIPILDDFKFLLIVVFFVFVTFYLVRFMRKSAKVNVNVIITAINIYLLIGIISGSLAFLFFKILPGAYNFPSYIPEPNFVSFNYYSFVTMSTVGYGDITPRLPQTQTLAYLIAVTGQLYVAIIMAFLVGKLLMHGQENEK
jgi:voltage-gated potassium channel